MLSGIWSFWLTNNLIRRWFIHYEPRSAIIRLFTLATIFWFAVVSFINYFGVDEPIWPWMAICAILAVSQIIQAVHFRFRGIYTIEPHKNPRSIDTRLVILRTVLIPGSIVSFITMMMLLHQNNARPSTDSVVTNGANAIGAFNVTKQIISSSETQILILILTSWAPNGHQKRQTVRETTLKLLPQSSSKFSFAYKFVLGEAPSAQARESMGSKIKAEQDQYDDVLILPVSDKYADLSLKVYRGVEWASKFKFDFLCKTDDDAFVRWDVVARELMELGPTHYYWRGLAFWEIPPITDPTNKNSDNLFKLGVFPPHVGGLLYFLSRDIVTLLTYPGPRYFTKNEDQNVGIWLHSYNIKPIHDRRIQQWDVCEDDMIAKHFSDSFTPRESMHDMYKNVIEGRPLCKGFRQVVCAACYPCLGRSNHWKEWGYSCDSVKGLTTIKQTGLYPSKGGIEIKDSMPKVDKKDEWILPGLLSETTSIYSDTDDWARLHWASWTTDPVTTWQTRHFQAIETLFVHNPNAVLIILSNTLPSNFFVDYTRQGYQIHVLSYPKEQMMKRKWFVSPGTEEWLKRLDKKTEAGKHYPVQIADYLRLVVLYKYGGLYMDLDALWIRAPGDGMTEFVGSDVSDQDEDHSWTMDDKNTYLNNGVMRFRRGRSMFRHIADTFFTVLDFDPECLNCGSKALTKYVKTHGSTLEDNGLRVLPPEALFPYSPKDIDAALRSTKDADEEIRRVEQHGIGLNLHGKMTNRKLIEESSVVAAALKIWGLGLHASVSSAPTLHGPKTLVYPITPAASSSLSSPSPTKPFLFGSKSLLLQKQPGSFTGVDAVFVRGQRSPSLSSTSSALVTKRATITISVQEGYITMDVSATGSRRVDLDMGESVTMAQLNTAFSRIRYLPPLTANSNILEGSDQVLIQVSFGEMQQELVIPVVRKLVKT
ncbi:hypothetical protein BGX34_011729 [Mortierella sp. NVP85]|nr:hypothetical protein BGX34_011729 [Mortierella sp. NVP85]